MQEIKLNGESMNIVEDNIEKLKSIFPDVFTEGKVDFDKLQDVLGNYIEKKDERYNFTWNGKSAALRLAQTPSTGTLRPCKDESIAWDTTQNLYIEGDNLEVLKLLQKSYHNKIKMIYIDPPYNTGGDFVYKDDYKDNLKNYKKITGQIDNDGNKLSTNSESDGRYHTNWLNMMYPRLKLARNLLANDGVIYISIDNNEICNLKKICDEVFGEGNFVTTINVELSATQGMKVKAAKDGNIVKNAEYILVYSKTGKKNIAKNLLYDYRPNYDDHYSKFLSKDLVLSNLKDEYLKYNPKANIKNLSVMYNEDLQFRNFVKENVDSIVADDKITGFEISDYPEINKVYKVNRENNQYYIYNNGTKLRQLLVLKDSFGQCDDFNKSYGLRKIRGDWWKEFYKDMGNVSKEGDVTYANGKKPVRLIKQLVTMTTESNDIILDFFSGSATTAHACMIANVENFTSRKFIMIQIPEILSQTNSDQRDLANFLKSINKPAILSEIGKERIRRAGNKIKEEIESSNLQLKLGESSKEVPDIGFKVFKLDTSNIKKWNGNADTIESEIQGSIFNYEVGRSELDVVYEIMLKCGLDLTYPIEEINVNGKTLYSIGAGAMFVCMDNDITQDVADKIVEIKDANDIIEPVAVFKDNGFKTDSNKTNIKETLRVAGIKDFITV